MYFYLERTKAQIENYLLSANIKPDDAIIQYTDLTARDVIGFPFVFLLGVARQTLSHTAGASLPRPLRAE